MSAGTFTAARAWSVPQAAPTTAFPRSSLNSSPRWSSAGRSFKYLLLLWDYAALYATERELFPTYTLRWNTPANIRLCLDDAVPIGSSQHQKLVVIDDAIAFTGGLDVTVRRWDTSDHRADNPLRRDHAGRPYEPFHDVQMLLDGAAARALADLARTRWEYAAHEPLPPVEAAHDPWPSQIEAEFTDINIGIARTQPYFERQAEVARGRGAVPRHRRRRRTCHLYRKSVSQLGAHRRGDRQAPARAAAA